MADVRVVPNVVLSDPSTPSQIAAVDSSGRLSVSLTASSATVTVDSELPAAAALADATANPTVPGVGGFLMGYNGTTWDRVRTANTGRLQVDVVTGGGSSASVLVDNAAFTDSTSSVDVVGYIFDEVAGTALTENDAAAARIDSKRAQVIAIEDASTRGQRLAIDASGRASVSLTASSATVTVDSELPAAAALADATANPTVPGVGAFALMYNGATWDRIRGNTTGGLFVHGNAAQDSPIAGNPMVSGGRASTATPTAMSADGDVVFQWLDRSGGQIINGRDAHDAALNANTNPVLLGARSSTAAPTNVSTDGDAVRLWAIASGALAVVPVSASNIPIPGEATNGLDVDVTRVQGTVTVDSELPAAAALADATANPTVPAVGSFLMGYNGTTWDRVRTANTGRLQVDVISGGGSDSPTNPINNYSTSSSLAAGSTSNHDTTDFGAATKKVAKVIFSSSVPLKAELQYVDNGSATTLAVGFSGPGMVGELVPSHRNYWSHTFTANAGFDGFRVIRTNLDASEAADVYSVIQYED